MSLLDSLRDNRAAVAAMAVAIAIPAEGLRQYAYKDVTGLPTICFGHTGGVSMGDFRTIPECRALLTEDMYKAIGYVERCAPGLPNEVLAAFSDAAFNIGPKVACDAAHSTAARKLKSGDLAGACNELPKWDKARVAGVMTALPGLTRRRELERALCLKGVK